MCSAAFAGELHGMFARGLEVSPCSISSAPSARMAAFFSTELPCGTTIVAARPWRAAAKAIDWPWLPRVALITERTAGSRCRSASM